MQNKKRCFRVSGNRKTGKISIIAIQFSMIISILIIGIMGITGYFIIKGQKAEIQRDMLSKGKYFVNSISSYAKQAFFPEPDIFFLKYLTEEMLKDESIIYVSVYKNGEKIASSKKDIIQKYSPYRISESIKLKDVIIGNVELGFSQDVVIKKISETVKNILKITLAAVAIGILLTVILVTILVAPVNKLLSTTKEIEKGNFEIKVDIKSKNEIGQLAKAFNEMADGLKEREFIKTTFKSYVPKQIAELLIARKNEIILKGETRIVSVLFSDIRGFTALSEKLPAEEVVLMLNDYFKLMTEIIFKNDGVLDKFMGDAILSFWNAPFDQANHSLKAVKCGVEMLDTLFRYNLDRKRTNRHIFETMGIGITTGPVVAGTIGSEQKMEYTVIGDTVNLAARIQAVAKNQIFLSETTYNYVKDNCYASSLGKMKFKGKEEEMEIFELKGLKGSIT